MGRFGEPSSGIRLSMPRPAIYWDDRALQLIMGGLKRCDRQFPRDNARFIDAVSLSDKYSPFEGAARRLDAQLSSTWSSETDSKASTRRGARRVVFIVAMGSWAFAALQRLPARFFNVCVKRRIPQATRSSRGSGEGHRSRQNQPRYG